ncbi:MAG: hypothetical protein LBC61_03870 [Candidatus Peribacteria bacterium]|jgi:hypothetical protein|nr:hypothetical protein [Candidatus Peribacteria bacterium]
MYEIDILKEIDNSSYLVNNNEENKITYIYEVIVTKPKKNRFISSTIFLIKYLTTSSLIFLVLLLTTNYSAYISVAKSYLMEEKIEETKNSIISSVEAAKISEVVEKTPEEELEEEAKIVKQLSINKYKKELDSNDINLSIDITTLDNRIIIPKI